MQRDELTCPPLLRQIVDCTSDSRGPQSVTKPMQSMAKAPSTCLPNVSPHMLTHALWIFSFPVFQSFIFVSCSVSKFLFPCAHLPYGVFFLILPSNRNPESHDQSILFAVSAQTTEPREGLGWKGPVSYSNTLQGHPQGTLGTASNWRATGLNWILGENSSLWGW